MRKVVRRVALVTFALLFGWAMAYGANDSVIGVLCGGGALLLGLTLDRDGARTRRRRDPVA